ncbi:nitroreductase family protein [Thermocoleostomius sinensis]|uniref:Nitroreductase family protein n=1 Tax=Thermocoleostomius sinensis A174 TaxID=2016057 RepID=A0A9E9CC27_9CYAN|nr:nitroreductase family protein [Thermocoleostomius sinensis]WAL61805.1 nitroreductase family protein [Thermocoleostomius sinensis A174]
METDASDNHGAATSERGARLRSFLDLVRGRRSTRHFRPDPVPPDLLNELLEAARWAPSGFNLQPTHFVVVTSPESKAKLYPACGEQRQVLEAGATVVFTGDRRVAENHLDRVLKQDREAGAINEAYEQMLRKNVPLLFHEGPLGISRFWKAAFEAVAGQFVFVPGVQAAHKSFWLGKQVCLSAMAFMLAAQAAGLASCPMEGFRECWVRRALGIPSDQLVVLVVAVGYPNDSTPRRTRLPLDGRVHHNGW